MIFIDEMAKIVKHYGFIEPVDRDIIFKITETKVGVTKEGILKCRNCYTILEKPTQPICEICGVEFEK